MTNKEQMNKCQCYCNDCGAECEPFWKKENKDQIIIDGCNVSNCKYYMENNGVEYQGLYQYTNMCYKLPYDNCENKPFCWHKLATRIKRIFKYGR